MRIQGSLILRSKAFWIPLALALLALALALVSKQRPPLLLGTGTQVTVQRGDLPSVVPATGSLVAAHATEIKGPFVEGLWEFRILSLVPEGTEVRVGDLLVEFDTREISRRINEQRDTVDKAREEIRKCELEYDVQLRDLRIQTEAARVNLEKARHKAEVDAKLMSMQEFRQLQIHLEQAREEFSQLQEKLEATQRMLNAQTGALKNTLRSAQLRLNQLQAQQKVLRVTAPVEGIVIYGKSSTGEKRAVGQSAWRDEVILQFPELSSLQMAAVIEEADSGAVRVGQKAKIRLDAYPEVEINGSVETVGTILRAKGPGLPVKAIDAVISLTQPDIKLLPGMTATALIEVQRLTNVLLIPLKAVIEKDGRTLVMVAGADGNPVERQVVVGRGNQEWIEVVDGLKEGERIYR